MRLSGLLVALQAASNLSPSALAGHVRRRLRNKIVPKRAASYRASLVAAATRLPAFRGDEAALELASLIADRFAAEYERSIPDCFDGKFNIMNREIDFGSPEAIDWRVDADEGDRQLRRANLCQMAFLAPAMRVDPSKTLKLIGTIVPGFIRTADFARSSDFGGLWHPYIASIRIHAILSARYFVPDELASSPEVGILDDFLRLNVAFVIRNLETELGFNHLERNLAAIGLFALSATTFPPEIAKAIRAHYRSIIIDSIDDDGVQKERSATYQGLTVQSLRIYAALPIWNEPERRQIDARLKAAELALAALTLGDDQPVLFNDGWLGEAPPSSMIVGADRPGFHVLPDGGYVRLADVRWTAIFDAGPIGPKANPGHGHPDFLSVEASFGPHRLLVDPGTFSYSAGSKRDELRAWSAHNGPAFVGPQPVVFLGSFKVGRRSAAEIVSAGADATGQTAVGRLAFQELVVTRKISLTTDGVLEMADSWAGEGERQTRFLIPAEWTLTSEAGGLLISREGASVRLAVRNAEIRTGKSVWSRYYGILEEAHEIIVAPLAGQTSAVTTLAPLPGLDSSSR